MIAKCAGSQRQYRRSFMTGAYAATMVFAGAALRVHLKLVWEAYCPMCFRTASVRAWHAVQIGSRKLPKTGKGDNDRTGQNHAQNVMPRYGAAMRHGSLKAKYRSP